MGTPMTPIPATAARRDANERDIVSVFRKLGWSVSQAGPLDLVIGKHGRTVLIEVKDGAKMPSQQRLTPSERRFIENWRGEVYIVRTLFDAVSVSNGLTHGGLTIEDFDRLENEVLEIQGEATI